MKFGKYIQKSRREKNINQRTLASRVGIDVTYLSKIENDRLPPPSHETIHKLATELDEDPDELLVLADKAPKDMKEIITQSASRPDFLRSIKDLSDEDLKDVQAYVEKLKKKRDKSQ